MSETTYLKELVVVEDGIAYKFKGVSLSESNASTILDNLISEYTEQYNNLNTQVTALENQLELGQVKFVTNMTTLNTEQLINTLYVNDEVVGIVDDGSGIIPQVYLSDGSSVSLKEVERKEEDPDDGNEYIGYVNIPDYVEGNFEFSNGFPSEESATLFVGYDTNHGVGITCGNSTISGFRTLGYLCDVASPGNPIHLFFYTDDVAPYNTWVGSKLKFTNTKRNVSMTTTGTLSLGDGGGQCLYTSTDPTDLANIITILNDNWTPDQKEFTLKIEKVA